MSDVPQASRPVNPPALNWIRFLRNYGPIPTNGNLFDEHVNKALAKARVQPIILSTPHVDEMVGHFQSGQPGSILIAGTAGDGKTYHCRQLWTRLGGDPKIWAAGGAVSRLDIGGRTIVFIKDLSELNGLEGNDALDGLELSVAGGGDSTSYVIATNHGQILDRLRKRKDREGHPSPMQQPIQDAFLQARGSHERLRVFDLSRSAHRQSLEEVLRGVADHPEWASCNGCNLNIDGRVCPIFENRVRIIGTAGGGRLTRRLGDLIEIARLNGAHLPVRDLLALAANMLLGHPDAKEGLMTCSDVSRIQDKGTLDRASVYRNVFGANLPKRRAMSRPVFKTLALFGIGEETANGIDGLLVYGADDMRLRDSFDRFVASDPIYGTSIGFIAQQQRYLEGEEGARLDEGADPFLSRLADQRQRLFFTLPDDESVAYPFWGLTAFRFAGEYLALLAALESKRPVDERTRSRLTQGLNRAMTGLLLDNADKLFVASSGGFTQSKVSVLCEAELPSRRTAGLGMAIRQDAAAQRPCLDVSVAPSAQSSIVFGLTPVRFEFLCRVSEGALPGSFSNECLEDLLAFKAKLLRQAELSRAAGSGDEGEECYEEEGALGLTFIEIEEQNGHGFLKRISVRAPQ